MKDSFKDVGEWLLSNMKKYALFLWIGFSLGIFADCYFYSFGWWVIVIGSCITHNIQLKYLEDKKC